MSFKNSWTTIAVFIFLSVAVLCGQVGAATVTYTYDNLSRLTKADYGNGIVIEYTYDASGNRSSQKVLHYTPVLNSATPVGDNVTVSPGSGTTVTFSNVSSPGNTTVSTSNSGSNPPTGFYLGNSTIYYDITTTATYTPPVIVCFDYGQTQVVDSNMLHLFHYENNAWVDVTTSHDATNHIICGQVNTLSPFAIFEVDATPPTIVASLSPSPNLAGWHNTDVTVTFNCFDAESGIQICPAPITVSTGGVAQVITGTAVDRAGNGSSASVTVNIDKISPSITASLSVSPNAAGWHNTDVTVTFNCSDSLSGIASCPDPVIVSSNGAGQVITGSALDKAGNSSSTSVTINLDKTLPTLTINKSGTGNGTVTTNPVGIDCGADCSESYIRGTVFTLIPTPDSGSAFAGWGGDADCTDGSVTMTADKSCTAIFTVVGVGLKGEYYDNADLTGNRIIRTDAAIDFNWSNGSPDSAITTDTFSVRWTGKIQVDHNETYIFNAITDDGIRLWIDGYLLIDYWQTGGVSINAAVALTEGLHDIKMEFFENTGDAFVHLYWSSPSTPYAIIPQDHLYPLDTQGNAPVLMWTGEGNYTSDGLDPHSGDTTTLFVYRIKYMDADGDAPMAGYPRVHILKGEQEIARSPIVMSLSSGSYSDGAIYTYSAALPEGTDYTYYFDARDATGLQATSTADTPTPTAPLNAPDVNTNLIMGDLDGSGRVDGFDLGRLGLAFGSRTGDPNWNPDADLNRDGIVDGTDLTILAVNFGKTK